MSFIIDTNHNFFNEYHAPSQKIFRDTHPPYSSSKNQQNNDYLRYMGIISKNPHCVTRSQQTLRYRFLLPKLYKAISVVLVIAINTKHKKISFSYSLLTENEEYIRVDGYQRRIILIKYLSSIMNQAFASQLVILINNLNGQLSIKSSCFPHFGLLENQRNFTRLIEFFRIKMMNLLKTLSVFIDKVVELNHDPLVSQQNHVIGVGKDNFYKNYQLSKLVNLYLYMCSQATDQQEYIKTQTAKEMLSVQTIKKYYKPFQGQLKSIQLFSDIDLNSKEGGKLNLKCVDKKNIQSKIEMPVMLKSKNPNQNSFVLNYIKLKQDCQIYKKISQGGFAKIELGKILFWYVSSYNLATPKTQLQNTANYNPLMKYVVIKTQQRLNPQERNRIVHESNILKKIKNGVSMFLPKYYIIAQNNPMIGKRLLSDYIDYPNLMQYSHQNKKTLSFQSKLFICYNIGQSLRYLSQYRIAHLDLKPANIMTFAKLKVKLIDFGQSYHPSLIKHQPGFSMPYSAPQNFNNPEKYDYKNDVFSYGVIMHEMFIGKFPFYFYDQKLKETIYEKGVYNRYWFNCSQGNLIHGHTIVFPLLQYIIMKCLHPNAQQRPELEWIVYFIRACLDYFY